MILFICSEGKYRSKTAADIFNDKGIPSEYIGIFSRYLKHRDLNRFIKFADIVFCMENYLKIKLLKYLNSIGKTFPPKCYVLDIEDKYMYNDDVLIKILLDKIIPILEKHGMKINEQ